jgi:hypothetical protein
MSRKAGYAALMNDTKWNELRLAMYELGAHSPKWRRRDLEYSYLSTWDGEWYYHFHNDSFATIEWLELLVDNPVQREAVHQELVRIHVPGESTANGFRIYGHVLEGQPVEYIV